MRVSSDVVIREVRPPSMIELFNPLVYWQQVYSFWINISMIYGGQLFREPTTYG